MAFSFNSLLKGFVNLNVFQSELNRAVQLVTSNDREIQDSDQINIIAEATKDEQKYPLIMKAVWERINQKPKDWKVTYKTMNLVEAILRSGAAKCIDDVRSHDSIFKQLQHFEYINSHQIDCGINVREKAKVMLDYLASDDILRDMRADARRLKERLTKGEGSSIAPQIRGTYSPRSYSSGVKYQGDGQTNSWDEPKKAEPASQSSFSFFSGDTETPTAAPSVPEQAPAPAPVSAPVPPVTQAPLIPDLAPSTQYSQPQYQPTDPYSSFPQQSQYPQQTQYSQAQYQQNVYQQQYTQQNYSPQQTYAQQQQPAPLIPDPFSTYAAVSSNPQAAAIYGVASPSQNTTSEEGLFLSAVPQSLAQAPAPVQPAPVAPSPPTNTSVPAAYAVFMEAPSPTNETTDQEPQVGAPQQRKEPIDTDTLFNLDNLGGTTQAPTKAHGAAMLINAPPTSNPYQGYNQYPPTQYPPTQYQPTQYSAQYQQYQYPPQQYPPQNQYGSGYGAPPSSNPWG